jgi:RNA polymerase sigma-70 factor (ECF subfamily)
MSHAAQPTDEVLVRRAQAGERDALVLLYHRYVHEIHGYLVNQLGAVQDAEDLTSETFLRLVRAIGSYRGRASFRTWLYEIARNQLRDHWRRAGRRPTVPLDPARDTSESSGAQPAPNPRASALGRAVLDNLPENYRTVLEHRIMDGRSVRDTAEEMGITPNNVKVMQHRALRRAAQIADRLENVDETANPQL